MRDLARGKQNLRIGQASRDRTIKRKMAGSEVEVWAKRLIVFQIVVWPLTFFVGFNTILLVFNLVSLLMGMAGLRWKSVGILGIALMCTLDALTRNFLATGGIWRWNTLNYWLLVVILVNFPTVLRFHDIHSRLLQVFLVFMGLMLSISLFVSSGIQDILNIGVVFGILISFMWVVREKKAWFWVGIVCGTAGFLGGAMYYLQIENLQYINPNSWSHFPLTALFAICLAMGEAVKLKQGRTVLILLAAANVVWIFLSGSRGSLLTSFVCVLYLVVVIRSITWTTFFIGIGLATLFWFSNFLLDQQVYAINRFEKMFDQSYTLAERTSGRTELLNTGWQIFLEQPLGIGTGSFRYGAALLNIPGGRAQPAHSAWIKTLAENGVLGMFIFTAWVCSFAIAGLRSKDSEKKALGVFTTLILIVSFVSKEFQGKDIWFLVAGAVVMLHSDKFHSYSEPVAKRIRDRRQRNKADDSKR